MSDNMCGPSNPLKSFGELADRERTAQQVRTVNASQASSSFRSTVAGGTSNGDITYANFQAGAPELGLPHAAIPHGNTGAGLPHIAGNGFAHPQAHTVGRQTTAAPISGGWATEFVAMSNGNTNALTAATPKNLHVAAADAAQANFMRPGLQPFAAPRLTNNTPGYFTGYPVQQAPLSAPPAPATAEVPQFSDEAFEAAFRQYDDDHRGDNAEFERAMDEWMAEHGPGALAAQERAAENERIIDRDLTELADQLEDQARLRDQEQSQDGHHSDQQPQGDNGNAELRRTAHDIVQNIGQNSIFQESRFVELMRRIVDGDVGLNAEQSDLVDAKTNQPLTATSRSGDAKEQPEESSHPPLSSAPGVTTEHAQPNFPPAH